MKVLTRHNGIGFSSTQRFVNSYRQQKISAKAAHRVVSEEQAYNFNKSWARIFGSVQPGSKCLEHNGQFIFTTTK